MSEQEKPKSFMEELNTWADANVIRPLYNSLAGRTLEWDQAVESAKKAIRTKVLESYRNGQAAARKPLPLPGKKEAAR